MNAQQRGWGAPCQSGTITAINVTGTQFPRGVRTELGELVTRLVQECKNRGYRFGTATNQSYGCWGYNPRKIAGTDVWSNHAWGLAVDINAPANPHKSPLTTDMPSWMPALWKQYGFGWGGDYQNRPDSMHYEFLGTPQQAATHTANARAARLGELAPAVPPFPFPAGHWMGVESNDPKNHSGANAADRPGIRQYQERMRARGWLIDVDGRFGPQTRDVTVKFQRQVGIAQDGLCGEVTWGKAWTAPVTP